MKSIILSAVFLSFSFHLFAQLDTLYMNGGKVLASVKEVTPEHVKFSYPNEDLINTVYKRSVKKIAFNNGRVQSFLGVSSIKPINSVADYEQVSVTGVEAEVTGLTRLGQVSAKAKGATTLSSQERVKKRAYRKMKIEAAMMGGNIVFLLNQQTVGNVIGTEYQSGSSTETNLTGIAYTNQLPDYDEFKDLLGGKTEFLTQKASRIRASSADYSEIVFVKHFSIDSIVNENGITILHGELEGARKQSSFQLANFDDEGFNIFYTKRNTSFNVRVLF